MPSGGDADTPQVLPLRRIMNRPGNQAASWRDDAGDDLAASVGRSRRACVWPPFKRGLGEAVGDRDSHAVRSPRLAALGSSLYPKGGLAGGRARRGHGQNPGPPPQGRPARPPVPAPPPHSLRCAHWGAFLSRGRFLADRAFPHRLCFLEPQAQPAVFVLQKTAPDIRARRLGIRQPQKGSFHGMLRCPCSEYIPSIPAPVASPDAKSALFAVQSSFARAIFRSDKTENTGNTCMYFRCFLCNMGGKEPRKTYRLPILRAPWALRGFVILFPCRSACRSSCPGQRSFR